MRCLILLAACALAFAQSNVRDLVRQSIQNGEIAWRNSFDYYCLRDDVTRDLGSNEQVKDVTEDLNRIVPLGFGASVGEHIKHNNETLPPAERLKAERDLAHALAESPTEKQHRHDKDVRERSYMKEVADAFDFRITGEENLPTGPAWVIEATPHAGYQPQSRYAHFFPYMRGTLWIDKQDLQWVKADAVATDSVSFGFIIARLGKGSHILIRQTRLPDGAWVASQIEAKASARIFGLFERRFEEAITYSDYSKSGSLTAKRE
jgi:hypothetical protein